MNPFAVGKLGGRVNWERRSSAQRQGLQSCEAEGPYKPGDTAPRRRPLGMLRRGRRGDISAQPPPQICSSLPAEHPPSPRGERRRVAEGARAGRGTSGAAGPPRPRGRRRRCRWMAACPRRGTRRPQPSHPPSSFLPTARQAGRREE